MPAEEQIVTAPVRGLRSGWGGPRSSLGTVVTAIALALLTVFAIAAIASGTAISLGAGVLAFVAVAAAGLVVSVQGIRPLTVRAVAAERSVRFGPRQRLRVVFAALAAAGLVNAALFLPAFTEVSSAVRYFAAWLPISLALAAWGVWGAVRGPQRPAVTMTTEGVDIAANRRPLRAAWNDIVRAEVIKERVVVTTRSGQSGGWICTQLPSDPLVVVALINRYKDHPETRAEIGPETLARIAEGEI